MTTWDGKAISAESPHGATIVVYRRKGTDYKKDDYEFLILHRAQAAEANGDWAWTPPSGARYPGEMIDDCARRELWEETGLELCIQPVGQPDQAWATYCAEASPEAIITLDEEHDMFAWIPAIVAVATCLPAFVGAQITHVVQDLSLTYPPQSS
ncbi:MAG: NUDIX hydrolase [Litorilinea sp.]